MFTNRMLCQLPHPSHRSYDTHLIPTLTNNNHATTKHRIYPVRGVYPHSQQHSTEGIRISNALAHNKATQMAAQRLLRRCPICTVSTKNAYYHNQVANTTKLHIVSLPNGLLDDSILNTYHAIAQQTNCVGLLPAGLADKITTTGFPMDVLTVFVATTNSTRRYQDLSPFLSIPDHARTTAVEPWTSTNPTVINMNAQWEKGSALHYESTQTPFTFWDLTVLLTRIKWFQQCLNHISAMGNDKPRSIAFPDSRPRDPNASHKTGFVLMLLQCFSPPELVPKLFC